MSDDDMHAPAAATQAALDVGQTADAPASPRRNSPEQKRLRAEQAKRTRSANMLMRVETAVNSILAMDKIPSVTLISALSGVSQATLNKKFAYDDDYANIALSVGVPDDNRKRGAWVAIRYPDGNVPVSTPLAETLPMVPTAGIKDQRILRDIDAFNKSIPLMVGGSLAKRYRAAQQVINLHANTVAQVATLNTEMGSLRREMKRVEASFENRFRALEHKQRQPEVTPPATNAGDEFA